MTSRSLFTNAYTSFAAESTMEDKKRDYQKEYEATKNKNKFYGVKIPLFLAIPLEEKLKKDKKTFTSLVKEAIEKYLKK